MEKEPEMSNGRNKEDPKEDNNNSASEDESEILEESPDGRWQKRRESVAQRDVPGIDDAHLAMDTEDGKEVVWNEVLFSERKLSSNQQQKIRLVFDSLLNMDHPNIAKFHQYWIDTSSEKPKVVFITEYMAAGSLRQFLRRTKKTMKPISEKSWRRWCVHILSALNYLHSSDPPIVHGNLSCDTIFFQNNGIIKIGSVYPDAINNHVKTCRETRRNFHYIAPEYENSNVVGPAADIYAFGMCALEMAVPELGGNGEGHSVSQEVIDNAIEQLEPLQKVSRHLPTSLGGAWGRCRPSLSSTAVQLCDHSEWSSLQDLVLKCLQLDPDRRPTARELLFHPVLFEVPPLKVLAAHLCAKHPALLPDEESPTEPDQNQILAEIISGDGRSEPILWRRSQSPKLELEKLLEDVRNGVYPQTAFVLPLPKPFSPRATTPEGDSESRSDQSSSPSPTDREERRVVDMYCLVKTVDNGSARMELTLRLKMEDKIIRHLECNFDETETPDILADEMVTFGLINEADRDKVSLLITDGVKNRDRQMPSSISPLLVQSTA